MNAWKVLVRMPALGVTAACIALGLWGAVDWGPALATACVAAFTAKMAGRFVSRRRDDAAPGTVIPFAERPGEHRRFDRAA